jgi:hypothetical protein
MGHGAGGAHLSEISMYDFNAHEGFSGHAAGGGVGDARPALLDSGARRIRAGVAAGG